MFCMTLLFLITAVSAQTFSTTVSPLHYEINLEPEFSELTFQGTTNILLQVHEATSQITLNARNLEITTVVVVFNEEEIPQTWELSADEDTITLSFSTQLEPADSYNLHFVFAGRLSENLEGFYVSQYINLLGFERKFALVNLKFNQAREVFPSFDDPRYLTTFDLSITRPKGYYTVSGSELKNTIPDFSPEKDKDEFATSEAIPTYLLSFAIIDFEPQRDHDKFAIYSYKLDGAITLLESTSSDTATEFSKLVTSPTKLKQIIVPDHAIDVDVVEKNGIVFYRQSTVPLDLAISTTEELRSLKLNVAHAFAKRLYVNEDPTKFWENFWVNEGIATFNQYEILQELQESGRFLEQFIVQKAYAALEYEELEEGLTLAQNEALSEDVLNNPIFYDKAAAVTRMLLNYKKPSQVSDISEDDITLPWASRQGHPLVEVERNFPQGTIEVTQTNPFSSTETSPLAIPFSLFTVNRFFFQLQLIDESSTLDLTLEPSEFALLDKQLVGYYRVKEDLINLQLVISYLNSGQKRGIDAISRSQLLDDSYHLAEAGQLPFKVYFDFLNSSRTERDFIALYTFYETTSRLNLLLRGTPAGEKFKKYARGLVEALYEENAGSDLTLQSDISRLNHIHALTWLCKFDHEDCLRDTNEILLTRQDLHPDLQEIVYCGGMRSGNLSDFSHIYNRYRLFGKFRIIKALGCQKDETLLENYLLGILEQDSTVPISLLPHHKFQAFLSVISENEIGVNVALEILKQHSGSFFEALKKNELTTIINELSKRIVTPEEQLSFNEFFDILTDDQKILYEQVFAKARGNIDKTLLWRTQNVDTIDEILTELLVTTTTSTTTTTTTTTTSTTTTTTTNTPTPATTTTPTTTPTPTPTITSTTTPTTTPTKTTTPAPGPITTPTPVTTPNITPTAEPTQSTTPPPNGAESNISLISWITFIALLVLINQ